MVVLARPYGGMPFDGSDDGDGDGVGNEEPNMFV